VPTQLLADKPLPTLTRSLPGVAPRHYSFLNPPVSWIFSKKHQQGGIYVVEKALWALGFVAGVLLAAPSLRAQGNYLDVYIAKVKPEKAADAEAIARKIADANRHNNGDHVIAMETLMAKATPTSSLPSVRTMPMSTKESMLSWAR